MLGTWCAIIHLDNATEMTYSNVISGERKSSHYKRQHLKREFAVLKLLARFECSVTSLLPPPSSSLWMLPHPSLMWVFAEVGFSHSCDIASMNYSWLSVVLRYYPSSVSSAIQLLLFCFGCSSEVSNPAKGTVATGCPWQHSEAAPVHGNTTATPLSHTCLSRFW